MIAALNKLAQRLTAQKMDTTATAAHIAFLYDGLRGYAEVVYANGNPDDVDLQRYTWLYVDGNYSTLVATIGMLTAKYQNVYVGITVYSHKKRCKANAIPTRNIVLDDAPANPPLPYSLVVQTGGGLPQAYYRFDSTPTIAQSETIAAHAARVLGADKSGSDITQLVRVAGTFNTKPKYGGCVPVRITDAPLHTYALETIAAAYALPNLPAADDDTGLPNHWDADVQAILKQNPLLRVRYILANIRQLLDTDGIPARVKDSIYRANFASDRIGDSSRRRFALTASLIVKGYAEDEIIALILHFAPSDKKNKTIQDMYIDAARCIAKARRGDDSPQRKWKAYAPHHGIHPAFRDGAATLPPVTRLPQERAQVDNRPSKLETPAFYEWLKAEETKHAYDGIIPLGRKEIAARFKVSYNTIRRIETELLAAGMVERVLSTDKQTSFICLATSVHNPPPYVCP